MTFNKKNLLLALVFPAFIAAGLLLIGYGLQSDLAALPLVLIYLEHVMIGWLFGFDLGRDAGSGFIALPLNVPVLIGTLVFDYLLLALTIYFALNFFRKSEKLR